MANRFKIGYIEVTENFVDGEFSVIVRDSRTGITKRKAAMSLAEYDQALDILYKNPSIEGIHKLQAFTDVSCG